MMTRPASHRKIMTVIIRMPHTAVAKCWLAPIKFSPDDSSCNTTSATNTGITRPKPPNGFTPPRKQANTVMHWTVNLVTPDNGEKFLIEMSNATLTNIKGFTKLNAELTVTINRSDLNQVMVGAKSFEQLEADGKARFEGDRRPFNELRSILTVFTPDFEIFPATANARPVPTNLKPFQYGYDLMSVAE